MRRILLAAAALPLSAAACDIQLGDTNGPMSGTWRYHATAVPAASHPGRRMACDYDLLLTLTQNGEQVVGTARPAAEVLCRAASGVERRTLSSTHVRGEIHGDELHLVVESTLHSVGPVTGGRVHGRVLVYGWEDAREEVPRSGATFTMERL